MALEGAVLAGILNLSGPEPRNLGVDRNMQLRLCPRSKTCVSTYEEVSDAVHYIPPWVYNPASGRGMVSPASRKQAMEELAEAVSRCREDNYTPIIVEKTDDYLYAQFVGPIFGFKEDIEFYFPEGSASLVEYRSASRVGQDDRNSNRRRVRAIRKSLEKVGWRSVGF